MNRTAALTVLEASAGTGKTHRVSTEAVRALAQGVPIEAMLLVTFTVAATSELRSRVWGRLATVHAELDAWLTADVPVSDELAAELVAGGRDEVDRVAHRLAQAVARFDAATITTIHGFCHQVLRSLGFWADAPREPTFVEDLRDVREEVVADLLVRKRLVAPDTPLSLEDAEAIARAVLLDPDAEVVPETPTPDSVDEIRVSFARAVRRAVEAEKRSRSLLGFDDLLRRVAGALADDQTGVVRRRLADRFALVIVDEFQDTDNVQWDILRRAFVEAGTRVILVGDPKQAVYAFRGADVHAYLAARRTAPAGNVEALALNWRSDADLLAGLDALFGQARLGHDEITYARTESARPEPRRRLHGAPRSDPVRLRLVPTGGDGLPRPTETEGIMPRQAMVEWIAGDLAADVVHLLNSGAEVEDAHGARHVVAPGDVAVLVSRNRDASTIQDALLAVGVPAVINGTGSVFDTEAARAWLAFLEAVERPSATTAVRNAALTTLLGWTARRIDEADDDEWDELHDRMHAWSRLLAEGNVSALFEQLSAATALPARILARAGGERLLTDLRHLSALLHAEAATGDGAAELVAWLRERVRDPDSATTAEDRSRRLETDANAVQVWTVHRSKGLEYPIVYAPFLWLPPMATARDVLVFHDPTRGDGGARVIDVRSNKGPDTAARRRNAQTYLAEQRGEQLRLAYVALTRAKQQVVLWWARGTDAHLSPLARLLCGDEPLDAPPHDSGIRTRSLLVEQASGGCVRVETELSGATATRWHPASDAHDDLMAEAFTGRIDRVWRRTSYSALTALAHELPDLATADDDETEAPTGDGTAPEHDERGIEDERLPDATSAPDDDAIGEAERNTLTDTVSVFGEVGGGARFGTLVHAVLETVDFTADPLEPALAAALDVQLGRSHDDLDRAAVVAGLAAAVRTPLGPLVEQRPLAAVTPADRLDELHFELPLVGGDTPDGPALTMEAIASAVDEHLPGDDPMSAYRERLRDPRLSNEVRGYLSGSIDVVLRHGSRFLVLDHKSNWLGTPGEQLTTWHYRPAALRSAMIRADYVLQALLYSVALHRYLRWRQPSYDPERNLGGCLYLFLRGMVGPDTPRIGDVPAGVWSWRPPAALIEALSDVLDRGTP